MAKPRDLTVLDTDKQVMRCMRCGEECPMPLGDVRWVAGVLKAFSAAHRACMKFRGRRCYFADSIPRRSDADQVPSL